MRLVSLSLKNIRSYTDCTIAFPKGIILLSGDIGSGKTTLLLATEFALFGVLRGDVSGSVLLRYGTTHGQVTLTIEINNELYQIGRSLKKLGEEIKQEKCWIESTTGRKECTPIELKAEVLGLLGYSPNLINKSKSLVYRYTIYTPQEQMKKILEEDSAFRLGIIRSLFDLDKYEHIRVSAGIYSRYLRSFALSKQDDIKKLQVIQQDLEKQRLAKSTIEQEIQLVKKAIDNKEQTFNQLKEEMTLLDEKVRKHATEETQRKHLQQTILHYRDLVTSTDKQLITITEHLSKIAEVTLPPTTENVIAEQRLLVQKRTEALKKKEEFQLLQKASAKHIIQNSGQLIESLKTYDTCPTCKQTISPDHIHKITVDQHTQKAKHEQQLQHAEKELQQVRKLLEESQQQLDLLTEQSMHIKHMQKTVQTKETLLIQNQALQNQKKQTQEQLKNLLDQLTLLPQTDIEDTKKVWSEKKQITEKMQLILDQEKNKYWKKTAELDFITKKIDEHETTIKALLQLKETVDRKQQTHTWLQTFFIPLQHTIERELIFNLHHQFETSFSYWYSQLMEGHDTEARIDDSFTPIIFQQGYQSDLINLSGGERTSIALAYRLALNDLLTKYHSFRAKDLLILDEPTDGFSAEQFSRLGEILQQLHLHQIIIVSHEPQLEGFVEHTFRIEKTGGKSQISRLT